MGTLSEPHRLTDTDIREGFCSGAQELDDWLTKYAKQNQRANNAITYVTTLNDRVIGYYAICSAGVSKERVPVGFASKRPRDIPCILLARLAVDSRAQGRKVGRQLLRDAIVRACQAAESIGAACLLVHCRDDEAKAFYMHQLDFLESPVDSLHLILPMDQARGLIIKPTS